MDNFEAAKTHFLAGLELLQKEDWSHAETEFRKSLALMPDRLSTLVNLSACLIWQGQLESARPLVDRALEIDPQASEAWINSGLLEHAYEHYEKAVSDFDRAIALESGSADAWTNRGAALHELLRDEDAIASHTRAVAIAPDRHAVWANLGIACESLQRDSEALECFRTALRLQPENHRARWSLGQLLIKLQDYPAGWEAFESRWQVKELALRKVQSRRPLWQGQRNEQPLMLWGEQGVGDQILYASMLPELADFPQRKMLALDTRLIPLFARSMPGFDYMDLESASDTLDFSVQLPLGSLPRYFRPSRESFAAARHPYLIADPVRTADLRQKIARPGKLVCGISWSSNRKRIGQGKSLALQEMLPPLADLPLHFVNLQYGDTSAERGDLSRQHGIEIQNVEEVDSYNDIDGLAALVQACDLVISTSNTTAHLAGALGKETLLLLPLGKGRLWYWEEHAGKNLWYPSIRMFVQDQPGQWQAALERLKSDLDSRSWL